MSAQSQQLFTDLKQLSPDEMAENAGEVAEILKSIANTNRLMILCSLAEGEKSVSTINAQVPLSQSALSQHLARLRRERLVATRKEGQTVFYRIDDPRIMELMSHLYRLYCAAPDARP